MALTDNGTEAGASDKDWYEKALRKIGEPIDNAKRKPAVVVDGFTSDELIDGVDAYMDRHPKRFDLITR